MENRFVFLIFMIDESIMEKSADKLIKHLSHEKNILKVIEECAELTEVMVKYLTKSEAYKPKKEKLIEEMGDVAFRIFVASRMLGVEDQVEERIEEKGKQLLKWIAETFEK